MTNTAPIASLDDQEPARDPMSTFGLPTTGRSVTRLLSVLAELGFRPSLEEIQDPQRVHEIVLDILAEGRGHQRLAIESGRWALGQPDPELYSPGDVPMLRALAVQPQLSVTVQRVIEARVLKEKVALAQRDVAQSTLANVYQATQMDIEVCRATLAGVPFFLAANTAEAVCGSHPIPLDQVGELRLPFPAVTVLFGADLRIDPRLVSAPPELAESMRDETALRTAFKKTMPGLAGRTVTIAEDIDSKGGYLTGVVLLADRDGGLSNTVLFLATSNPDTTLEFPMNLDRIRGIVAGHLDCSYLQDAVRNVAAVVCHADWQVPPARKPPDLSTREGRRSLRHNSVRRAIANGDFAEGVHLLQLRPSAPPSSSPRRSEGPMRASPSEHLRRGFFQRVVVGPRADGGRKQVWKAPKLINPGVGERRPNVVYMVPAPPWMDKIARPAEADQDLEDEA